MTIFTDQRLLSTFIPSELIEQARMTKPVSSGLFYGFTIFLNPAPIHPNLRTLKSSHEKGLRSYFIGSALQQKDNHKVLSKQEKETNLASATTKMNSGCSE